MKKITENVLGTLLGLLVAIVAIEIGLRIAGIEYPFTQMYDPARGIKLKPNADAWYEAQGGFYMKSNSLGYRDDEHTILKPDNTFRIAVVGDSFVEAREVDPEDSAWKLLGKFVADCPDLGGKNVEILTFGVGGYGTTQEFLTLKMHVMQFAPDLVLLSFTTFNDLADNSKVFQMAIRDGTNAAMSPYYVRIGDELVLDQSYKNFSFLNITRRIILSGGHYSRLIQVINRARNVIVGRLLSSNTDHDLTVRREAYRPPINDMWRESWAITEEVLLMMKHHVERERSKFALAILTDEIRVDASPDVRDRIAKEMGVPDFYYAERRLKRLGEDNGFSVFPLASRFREEVERTGVKMHRSVENGWGGHWNEDGHRLAGMILAQNVCSHGLLQ